MGGTNETKIIPYNLDHPLTLKQKAWLKSYLKCFNMSQASRDAGYNIGGKGGKTGQGYGEIGIQNFKKLRNHIKNWIDNVGLSDEAIQAKIANGFNAKETKFFTDKGIVTDQREVEALGIQQRYVDMAAKVKGLYAPEKKDITGTVTVLSPKPIKKEID